MSFFVEDAITLDIFKKLKLKMRINTYNSPKFPLFIFVCGAQILESGNILTPEEQRRKGNKRRYIIDKIESELTLRQKYAIVAEELFSVFDDHDSLTYEGILGEISDEIIIIIESWGTVCELGAFSFSDRLKDKLFIINNIDYLNENSFINTGPIAKLKSQSSSEVQYVNFDVSTWSGIHQMNQHFTSLGNKKTSYIPGRRKGKYCCVHIKSFLFEIINLVELLQPITSAEVLDVYKFFKGKFEIIDENNNKFNNIEKILEVLLKLQVLEKVENYYIKNTDASCYNCMFSIDKSEMNKTRSSILSRVMKKDNYRMKVIYDGITA